MKIKFINIEKKSLFEILGKYFYKKFSILLNIIATICHKKIICITLTLIIFVTLLLTVTKYLFSYNHIISEILPTAYDTYEQTIASELIVVEPVVVEPTITYPSTTTIPTKESSIEEQEKIIATNFNIVSLNNFEDLKKYVYTVDKTAFVTIDDFPIKDFLEMNFKTNLNTKEPKVLIFHTHSQETFIDSVPGVQEDTIVGVGNELSEILVHEYGIPVVHDVGKYDFVNGKVERGNSYENMEPAVKKIIEKYPSIEIAIDLHRDAMEPNTKLLTVIDGVPTAKIMFFNGVTKENIKGAPKDLVSLINPFVKENLGLSLQLFLHSNELYPEFARKNYIKPYRYSLHLMPKSMLVEVGANTNTLQEAKNAMKPLAKILVDVLAY